MKHQELCMLNNILSLPSSSSSSSAAASIFTSKKASMNGISLFSQWHVCVCL